MGLFDTASSMFDSAKSSASSLLSGGAGKAFGMVKDAASSLASSVANGTARSGSDAYSPPNMRPEYQVVVQRTPDGMHREPITVTAALPENFGFNLSSTWSAPFADGLVSSDKINMLSQIMGMKWSNQAMSSNFWTGSGEVEFSLPLIFTAESSYEDVLKPVRDLVRLSLPSVDSLGFFRAPGPTIKTASSVNDLIQSTQNMVSEGNFIQKTRDAAGNVGQSVSDAATAVTQPGTYAQAENTLKSAGQSAMKMAADVYDDPLKAFAGIRDKLGSLMQFEGKIQLSIGKFMSLPSVVITNVNMDYKVLMSRDGVPMQVAVTVDFRTHQTPSAEDVMRWFTIGGMPYDISSLGVDSVAPQKSYKPGIYEGNIA